MRRCVKNSRHSWPSSSNNGIFAVTLRTFLIAVLKAAGKIKLIAEPQLFADFRDGKSGVAEQTLGLGENHIFDIASHRETKLLAETL